MGITFVLGIWRLREHPPLASLTIFMLLSIPFLYLVLDPLAPPSLQGAAPRYLIYILPYFLYVAALGAGYWKPFVPVLILVSLAGLYFLAKPVWSNGSSDLVNWQRILADAAPLRDRACILTDGRGYEPVKRYAPAGIKITRDEKDCAGFSRVVLVSDDYRLAQVRYLDQISNELAEAYSLVSNTTVFPAQVTVYDRTPQSDSSLIPSRLDLPEQDLHFPLLISGNKKEIQGFIRLDAQSPKLNIPLSHTLSSNLWALTNFRTESALPKGTPVFRLEYGTGQESKRKEIILRSGMETAAWEGSCDFCVEVYQWTKLLHLVGSTSYPGAYRQYTAHIWGIRLADAPPGESVNSMTITYLLPEGTGYFYGIYPELDGTQTGQ
jgi:hypothetical protein